MTVLNDNPSAKMQKMISVEKIGRCGVVTLNRPEALNALTGEMIGQIEPAFHDWVKDPHIYCVIIDSTSARAFCAGADIRALYHLMSDDPEKALNFFRLEYQNNLTMGECYKPIVPLVNGIVMGGGVGLVLHGTHCVMAEDTVFAMPEVSIGLFPDVGTSYRLARLPHNIGLYLALTGRSLTASDCYFLEIASHTIRSEHFPEIRNALMEAEPVDHLLEELQEDFGISDFQELAPVIERLFEGGRLEDILANLQKESADSNSTHTEWSKKVLADLEKKSPLSLKITFEVLRQANTFTSLKEALEMDFRIASRFMANSDFREGVRALLIDKDQKPKWLHRDIYSISDDFVQEYFKNLGNKELILHRYDLDVPV